MPNYGGSSSNINSLWYAQLRQQQQPQKPQQHQCDKALLWALV
jgi:hypothetical protein